MEEKQKNLTDEEQNQTDVQPESHPARVHGLPVRACSSVCVGGGALAFFLSLFRTEELKRGTLIKEP